MFVMVCYSGHRKLACYLPHFRDVKVTLRETMEHAQISNSPSKNDSRILAQVAQRQGLPCTAGGGLFSISTSRHFLSPWN